MRVQAHSLIGIAGITRRDVLGRRTLPVALGAAHILRIRVANRADNKLGGVALGNPGQAAGRGTREISVANKVRSGNLIKIAYSRWGGGGWYPATRRALRPRLTGLTDFSACAAGCKNHKTRFSRRSGPRGERSCWGHRALLIHIRLASGSFKPDPRERSLTLMTRCTLSGVAIRETTQAEPTFEPTH